MSASSKLPPANQRQAPTGPLGLQPIRGRHPSPCATSQSARGTCNPSGALANQRPGPEASGVPPNEFKGSCPLAEARGHFLCVSVFCFLFIFNQPLLWGDTRSVCDPHTSLDRVGLPDPADVQRKGL